MLSIVLIEAPHFDNSDFDGHWVCGAFSDTPHWKQHRFDAAITEAARQYGLDAALIRAVIWQESRFNPGVRGRAGELGLMQIREAAAAEWAAAEHIKSFKHSDCLDPDTNILAGSYYLKSVLRYFLMRADDPIPYALAEYNAGRGNVLKWLLNGSVHEQCRVHGPDRVSRQPRRMWRQFSIGAEYYQQ